jgi:hypothetical protein
MNGGKIVAATSTSGSGAVRSTYVKAEQTVKQSEEAEMIAHTIPGLTRQAPDNRLSNIRSLHLQIWSERLIRFENPCS